MFLFVFAVVFLCFLFLVRLVDAALSMAGNMCQLVMYMVGWRVLLLLLLPGTVANYKPRTGHCDPKLHHSLSQFPILSYHFLKCQAGDMIDTLQFSRRRDVCTKLNMRSKQSDPWVLIAWVSCLFLAPPQTPSKQPPISNLLVPRSGMKKTPHHRKSHLTNSTPGRLVIVSHCTTNRLTFPLFSFF